MSGYEGEHWFLYTFPPLSILPFIPDGNNVASNPLSFDGFGGRQEGEVNSVASGSDLASAVWSSNISELDLLVLMNSLAVTVPQGFGNCC